jgi:hypothetical protein
MTVTQQSTEDELHGELQANTLYVAAQSLTLPFVPLHVVEFTFQSGFESLSLPHWEVF